MPDAVRKRLGRCTGAQQAPEGYAGPGWLSDPRRQLSALLCPRRHATYDDLSVLPDAAGALPALGRVLAAGDSQPVSEPQPDSGLWLVDDHPRGRHDGPVLPAWLTVRERARAIHLRAGRGRPSGAGAASSRLGSDAGGSELTRRLTSACGCRARPLQAPRRSGWPVANSGP